MPTLEDLYTASTGKFKTIVTNKDETPYSKGGSSPAADTKDAKGVTVSDNTFGDIDIKATDKDGFFTQAKLDAARGGTIGELPSLKLAKGYTAAPSYGPGDKGYSKVVKK